MRHKQDSKKSKPVFASSAEVKAAQQRTTKKAGKLLERLADR